MITSHNIATLSDKRGRHDIEFEVNPGDKESDLVLISMRDEDGHKIQAAVDLKQLYGLIFSLMGPEEQADMMPVRQTTMTTFHRQHRISVKRDIKKGEELVVNCKVDVPTVITEGLSGIMKRKKSSGIYIPGGSDIIK
jgi:hypothetical protein